MARSGGPFPFARKNPYPVADMLQRSVFHIGRRVGKSWQLCCAMILLAYWGGRVVSLQVAIMKVLASYPGGHAKVAGLNVDLAVLSGAGPSWTRRLKRLAMKAPDLDIFGQAFVVRDSAGWYLTAAGRERLNELELPAVSKLIPRDELLHNSHHVLAQTGGTLATNVENDVWTHASKSKSLVLAVAEGGKSLGSS
jgi:hypothetical protein